MALNWGKAISAGLITAGEEMKAHGALRIKEEYMAEEKATAAAAAHQSKLEFLYGQNIDELTSIRSTLGSGLYTGDSQELEDRVKQIEYTNYLYTLEMFGQTPSKKEREDLNTLLKGGTVTPTEEEKKKTEKKEGDKWFGARFFDWVFSFPENDPEGKWLKTTLLTRVPADQLPEIKKIYDEKRKELGPTASEHEVYMETMKTFRAGRGKSREEAKSSQDAAIDKELTAFAEGATDYAKESFASIIGMPVDTFAWGINTLVKEMGGPEEFVQNPVLGKQWIMENGDLTVNDLLNLVKNRVQSGLQEVRQADEKRGLIGQGTATPDQEDLMAAGGEVGGSGYVEPPIGGETVSDISDVVGTEETLGSLFRDVGGPVGEPAGTTLLERANIPAQSEEVEVKKSNVVSAVRDLILKAEANVNGYESIAGSTEGDPNLTTMTVGEIFDKYGNKAVGAGQFKYREFMLPIVKKYLGMNEKELRDQVFTPQFQNDLITLGLEDAGLTELANGTLSIEDFQKRVANIWRGLPPTKETEIGETTDEFGNKARVEGGLLSQAIGQ